MATPDGKLGIARLQFGNVVLLPQMLPEAVTILPSGTWYQHAPPHTYIASYLWMQHGFKADALIHFGTHGSLELLQESKLPYAAMTGRTVW